MSHHEDGGRGGTPLAHALFYGYTEAAEIPASVAVVPTISLLLLRGASVLLPNDGYTYGGTPLHIAVATYADENIIAMLLEYGADINQSSDEGTPLDTATRTGSTTAVRLIETRGGKYGLQLGDWPHSRLE
ncbi:MAG: ankyrin repeat domain-containing protein [Gammaproteobacteria bacterium]|nr:ankyrin repeat domain-containing protein [Gammaproteobacteria bacterium]|tara:strand:- start:346 stop:738 length:393 start_codon:yes stop_codon:yes gene_type:complete